MSIFTDRRGNLSIFRVSLVAITIGAILIIGGIISFTLDQESRRSPFYPDLFPNAETWGAPDILSAGLQRVFYKVPGGDIDAIAEFYDQNMISHYGVAPGEPGAENCHRFPPVGNFADHEPGDGTVPFYYSCMFDRGGLNMSQSTEVLIQPGVQNEDPFLDSEGSVVIIYDQRWQP